MYVCMCRYECPNECVDVGIMHVYVYIHTCIYMCTILIVIFQKKNVIIVKIAIILLKNN